MSSGRDVMMENWEKEVDFEKQLVEISYGVDTFYTEQAMKYAIDLNKLNAIMLARLMRLNMEVGNEDGFKKLMGSIVTGELTPESKFLQ